jgi:hypothetical protein
MDLIGDGTGATSMNVNGSVTPVIFRTKPNPGSIIYISRMIWFLQDSGSIDATGFGNGPALTNGLLFRFVYDVGPGNEDGTPYPDPSYLPIKTNADWVRYCYDVQRSDYGQGDEVLGARYTFAKDVNGVTSELPWISDDRKEEFQLVIQDDLTGLVDATCRLGAFER